ncbi:aspartyl protease family protein At5g10770-like [Nicotiana tomentosiformis]|uniref:aspartyl protease family protein At5g10770-like n=1 Tax=Nicotiana tomentosiformis TaxID=4098 RepID=UPI00051B3907|nr:aspartyl protease family protein At5g10770-like [Nicotiana tomentosiformis]
MAWIIKHIVTICFFLGYYQTLPIYGETIRAPPHYKVVNVSSLEPKPYCQRSSSGSKIGSQKLEIVSRFGPCFPNTNRTKTASSNELLNWDQARVRSINKRVNDHLYSNSLSEDGLDPTIEGKYEFGGVYNVKIGLGTPKQDYYLMMDTGSQPTWVRCQSCTKGCKSENPLYDPSKSSTYTNNTSVPFRVGYGDNSYTNGIWGCDTLTIEGIGAINNFRFGCGQENVDGTGNNFGDVAGILGLGRGELSFPSQIQSASSTQMFSYYVPLTNSHVGNLEFGNEAKKKSYACSNQFTPLVKGPEPVFYYLDLVGISVAGNKLNVTSTTFTNEGTVIDSGTVITRLPRVVYSAFRAAFRQSMSSYTLLENVDELMDTCYSFKGYEQIVLPEIKFHFREGTSTTDVTLSYNGILWMKNDRVKCLAFAAKESDEHVSIIGYVQQRGFNVLYDLERERIGFGSNCAS